MTTLTVYFDDPWWVGVIEIEEQGVLRAARRVFGAEPSAEQVLDFVLRDFVALAERSGASAGLAPAPRRVNPKRAAREAARQTQARGISTIAQEALRLQREAGRQERQQTSRAERERLAEHRRQKAHEKALARRRGH